MNRFILTGEIRVIKYLPDSIILYIDDMERGYKRADGVIVDDIFFSWKVVFSNNYKNFIVKFFNEGMLVDIDAKMRPFAVEQGESTQGYSCLGLSIQRSSYIKRNAKQELKMIKESQLASDEHPDLESYNQPDF
jgi:hypothetical protein